MQRDDEGREGNAMIYAFPLPTLLSITEDVNVGHLCSALNIVE
jgi:hypothetical protein